MAQANGILGQVPRPHSSASLLSSKSLVPAPPSCFKPQLPHLQRRKEITYHHLNLKHRNVLRNVGTRLRFSPGHITPQETRDSFKGNLTHICLRSVLYSAQKFLSIRNYFATKWGPMNKRKQREEKPRDPLGEYTREFSLMGTFQGARQPSGEQVFMRSPTVCQARG